MHTIYLGAFIRMEAPFLLEEVSDKTGRWGVENETSNQQNRTPSHRHQ